MDNKFSANDIYEIQECLGSYKILLDWLPTVDKEERDLKYVKLQIIQHLVKKCDRVLGEMKNG